jgi:hypothetical protein
VASAAFAQKSNSQLFETMHDIPDHLNLMLHRLQLSHSSSQLHILINHCTSANLTTTTSSHALHPRRIHQSSAENRPLTGEESAVSARRFITRWRSFLDALSRHWVPGKALYTMFAEEQSHSLAVYFYARSHVTNSLSANPRFPLYLLSLSSRNIKKKFNKKVAREDYRDISTAEITDACSLSASPDVAGRRTTKPYRRRLFSCGTRDDCRHCTTKPAPYSGQATGDKLFLPSLVREPMSHEIGGTLQWAL